MILPFFGGVVLTAVLLMAVASIVPGVEFEDWTPAFVVAVIASLLGIAISLVRPMLTASGLEGWPYIAVTNAISVLVLALAIALAPGVRKAGVTSVLTTAILVKAVGFGIAMAYAQVMMPATR
jgi:uncharacterized membrane protein YvlD (DUF360 family)